MTDPASPEHSALAKLQKLIEERDGTFTEPERRVLHRFAQVLIALETLGSLGAMIRSTLVWIGGLLALWFAFTNGLGQWVADIARKALGP